MHFGPQVIVKLAYKESNTRTRQGMQARQSERERQRHSTSVSQEHSFTCDKTTKAAPDTGVLVDPLIFGCAATNDRGDWNVDVEQVSSLNIISFLFRVVSDEDSVKADAGRAKAPGTGPSSWPR
jgi:hypothetical protein